MWQRLLSFKLLFSTTAACLNAATASRWISSMISISFPENEIELPLSKDVNDDIGNDVPRPISVPS